MGFIPREEKFFVLFSNLSDHIVEAAKEFKELLGDLKNIESRVRTIKAIEHKADEITHTTLELLHKTFITPLDRGDIHELVKGMDDIVDMIEAVSQRIQLYEIKSAPPMSIDMAEIVIKAAEDVRIAVAGLKKLKNPSEIMQKCRDIHKWENEADHKLRAAIPKLFHEEKDVLTIIKHKEIYELLEVTSDRCEMVANIIEGIVLEYA